jgi:hypothetical protein
MLIRTNVTRHYQGGSIKANWRRMIGKWTQMKFTLALQQAIFAYSLDFSPLKPSEMNVMSGTHSVDMRYFGCNRWIAMRTLVTLASKSRLVRDNEHRIQMEGYLPDYEQSDGGLSHFDRMLATTSVTKIPIVMLYPAGPWFCLEFPRNGLLNPFHDLVDTTTGKAVLQEDPRTQEIILTNTWQIFAHVYATAIVNLGKARVSALSALQDLPFKLYELQNKSGITQQDRINLWSELINLFEDAGYSHHHVLPHSKPNHHGEPYADGVLSISLKLSQLDQGNIVNSMGPHGPQQDMKKGDPQITAIVKKMVRELEKALIFEGVGPDFPSDTFRQLETSILHNLNRSTIRITQVAHHRTPVHGEARQETSSPHPHPRN